MVDPTAVSPGWYADRNGVHRYWDGETWLALPDPDADSPAAAAGNGPGTGGPAKGVTLRLPGRRVLIAIAALAVVLVGGGVAWGMVGTANARSAEQAAVAAEQAEAERTAARAQAARDEQAAKDAAERLRRGISVGEIQDSVQTMAEDHVSRGLMAGPIISVTCSPVGGGSTDDLTEATTVFDCFAATKDNGNGTMSGIKYHSTMNWDSGSYTYGRGAP